MSKSLKNIKRLIVKQIKKEYPNFQGLSKKHKKEVIESIWGEVRNNVDTQKGEAPSKYELLNIEAILADVLTIKQMQDLMQKKRVKLFRKFSHKKLDFIKDAELKDIREMVDWELINDLLKNRNYTPGKREILPVQFFQAELLKSFKYPEISYRKYDVRELNNSERKENRAFIGLGAHQQITHSQLSQFRSSLTFTQLLNVMVYFICLFLEKKPLSSSTFYAIDSTELAAKISPYPLFKTNIAGGWVRIYQDIDADVGTRRNKRDKSKFVVGYRLHTLTVIDVSSEQAFPLLSILAPANHHDSNFLKILVEFGKKIGLDLNIIAGDQAYGEPGEVDEIQKQHNVTVLNAPKEKTSLPANVDEKSYAVGMNTNCPIDMDYCGKDEEYGHEFHCAAEFGECPFAGSCRKVRFIGLDSGAFGQIPYFYKEVQRIIAMRKVAERPFNLIKHRDGLWHSHPYGRAIKDTRSSQFQCSCHNGKYHHIVDRNSRLS